MICLIDKILEVFKYLNSIKLLNAENSELFEKANDKFNI